MSTDYKAFKIDVIKREVIEIRIKSDYKEWQREIGNDCTMVTTCGISFNGTNDLIIDDEGLFKKQDGGFTYKDWRSPVLGNALVIGCDKHGDTCDVTCTKADIQTGLMFLPKYIANLITEGA